MAAGFAVTFAIWELTIALAKSAWRSLRRFGSVAENNLFAVVLLLMAEEPLDRPSMTSFFYLIVGVLVAFPLANDMTARIPAVRLGLWPLSRGQRVSLRIAHLLLNPVFFLAVLFPLLSRHRGIAAAIALAGVAAPVLIAVVPRLNINGLLRLVPRFPGRLGGLIQNHIREFLCLLDVWFAAVIALGGVLYLWFPRDPGSARAPDEMAPVVLSGFLVILLSTMAQANAGFDPQGAQARARLLPVSRRDLLLARDVAWVAVVVVITLPFGLLRSTAGAFAALAIGHQGVMHAAVEQHRGQFARGRLSWTGVFQIVGIAVAVATTLQFGWLSWVVCLAAWAISLVWFGRRGSE
jgi:hypothetical protein